MDSILPSALSRVPSLTSGPVHRPCTSTLYIEPVHLVIPKHQVIGWSTPETRHVADAAARWAPASFLLLKEHCRNGGSEAGLTVKVGLGGAKGWPHGKVTGGKELWPSDSLSHSHTITLSCLPPPRTSSFLVKSASSRGMRTNPWQQHMSCHRCACGGGGGEGDR